MGWRTRRYGPRVTSVCPSRMCRVVLRPARFLRCTPEAQRSGAKPGRSYYYTATSSAVAYMITSPAAKPIAFGQVAKVAPSRWPCRISSLPTSTIT